jgi:hypothetical protein
MSQAVLHYVSDVPAMSQPCPIPTLLLMALPYHSVIYSSTIGLCSNTASLASSSLTLDLSSVFSASRLAFSSIICLNFAFSASSLVICCFNNSGSDSMIVYFIQKGNCSIYVMMLALIQGKIHMIQRLRSSKKNFLLIHAKINRI